MTMPSRAAILGLLGLLALGADGAAAQSERTPIRYGGSSTAFPIMMEAAALFAKRTGAVRPIGEMTGTGGGIQLYCAGVGTLHPDMAIASRGFSPQETAACRAKGVETLSIRVGFDAVVVATTVVGERFALTRRQLWLALAERVPRPGGRGGFIPNPHANWRDIDPALPDRGIRVLAPLPGRSGKWDSFESLVLQPGCAAEPELRAVPDRKERQALCTALRADGRFMPNTRTDVGLEDLLATDLFGAIAVLGYGDLAGRKGLAALPIDGVTPTPATISNGSYPVTRTMFVHVKRPHLETILDLKAFAAFLVDDTVIGPEGVVARAGLVTLPDADRYTMRATVLAAVGARS